MERSAFIQPDTIFPSLTSKSNNPHTSVFSWDFISSGIIFETYHVDTLLDVSPFGLFIYDCPNEDINSEIWAFLEDFVKYSDQNVFCALKSESTSTTEEASVATDSAATSDSATTTTTKDISNPAETEIHPLQYDEKDHKSSMDVLFERLDSSETLSFKDENYNTLWMYLDTDMEAMDSESVSAAASSVLEAKTVESTSTVTTASASATTTAAPVNDNSSTVNANISAGANAKDGHKQTVFHLILGKDPDTSFFQTYFFCFSMLVFHIVWWVILTVITTMISNFIIMWIFRDVILVEVTWSGIHIVSQGDDEPVVDPKKLLTKEQVLSLPEVEFDKDGELNIVPMNTSLDIAFGGFDSDDSHNSLPTCVSTSNSPPSSPTRKARFGFKIGGGGGSATVMARNGSGEGDEESQLLLQDRHRMGKLKQRSVSFRNHTCSICLDDFEDKERVRVLPCGHMYHTDCVMPWLTTRIANCPLCKAPLFEDEKDKKHC